MSNETVVYSILTDHAAFRAIVGQNVFYIRAPQSAAPPYAVYNLLVANPENYLDDAVGIDRRTVQVSMFSSTASQARQMVDEARLAFEQQKYVCLAESFVGYEEETNLFHFVADFSLWLHR